MNIVFRAGKDSNGLPVFVFVTKHIELDRLDLHDILLYTIRTLDADVSSPEGYTMVIVYSQVTNNNVPPFSWAREVYDQLPRKCVDSLSCHPPPPRRGYSSRVRM